MSLKGVAKKVKDVHEVWDNVPLKLFLWIHEAFDLQGSKKVGCRVQVGRQKRKTKLVKPTETKWEDLMFFLPSEEDEVRIEVWDEHMLGDVFLGELELAPVKMMQIDEPTMLERDLLDQPGKKRKSKIAGRLKVSYYLSNLTETRPPAGRADLVMKYANVFDCFQTGDILLYEGAGLVSSLVKLVSGSTFSQVGMVLRLPNKWTEEMETYVLEYTRNLDGFLDAFAECGNRSGWNLFRAKERIHHFHGGRIWHCRLKCDQNSRDECAAKLAEYFWDVHGAVVSDASINLDPIDKILDENFSKHQYQTSLLDLCSPSLFLQALRSLNMFNGSIDSSHLITPSTLLETSLWKLPQEIRTLKHLEATEATQPKPDAKVFKGQSPQERYASIATRRMATMLSSQNIDEIREEMRQSLDSPSEPADVQQHDDGCHTSAQSHGTPIVEVESEPEVLRSATVWHAQAEREVVNQDSKQEQHVPSVAPVTPKAFQAQESQSVPRKRAAGKIPVILFRAKNCKLPELERPKTVLPIGSTVQDLVDAIKYFTKLPEGSPVFAAVNGQLLNSTDDLNEVYFAHKEPDGYLHVSYSDAQ